MRISHFGLDAATRIIQRLLGSLALTRPTKATTPVPPLLWTDDYSNLFHILKLKTLWSSSP